MLRESHLELVRTKGTLFGNALMGLLFLVSGVMMISTPANTANYFSSVGVPMATILIWPIVLFKIAAGLALIVGKRTTEAAAGLIVFTLIATLLVHLSPNTDPTFPIGLFKNLAIVGGLLYIMAFGPHGMNIKGQEAE
jgi:putative oxidoreductase